MSVGNKITAASEVPPSTALRRGPLLIVALLASLGAAAIYLFGLPALWRMSGSYGLLFTALGAAQLGLAAAAIIRPQRGLLLLAAIVASVVIVLWALVRIVHVLPAPDPWIPVNSVLGFTDDIAAILEMIAVVGLVGAAAFGRRRLAMPYRALAIVAFVPLVAIAIIGTVIGVAASSDTFNGAGFPSNVVSPHDLPPGAMSTVEYCRPDAVPLAMDIYMPTVTATNGSPAPVAVYVHGGGGIWGDRKTHGLGATQANHAGALFTPLQQQLNDLGFVVASIDYRLAPGTSWPASIEDAKCAVRFLRAHADDLNIDPERIGAWGSSYGGHLVNLLGLAGPDAGFDVGQYPDQSSAVQAVVDMFGSTDLNNFDEASGFTKVILQIEFGSSSELRQEASPITYITSDAPPFLILHGTEDPTMPMAQSLDLAHQLSAAGVSNTVIQVQGAEHSLETPGQQPSPEALTTQVVDFFVETLKGDASDSG